MNNFFQVSKSGLAFVSTKTVLLHQEIQISKKRIVCYDILNMLMTFYLGTVANRAEFYVCVSSSFGAI